jgi:hypothetical protein
VTKRRSPHGARCRCSRESGVQRRKPRLPPGRLTRQRAPAALIATAQLGVPAAVVTLGLRATVITAAQGAAIITAALASLGTATLGTALLARQAGDGAAAGGDERQAQPAAHG